MAKDCQRAVKLLEQGAMQGQRDSQFLLGHCLFRGRGVAVNKQRAPRNVTQPRWLLLLSAMHTVTVW